MKIVTVIKKNFLQLFFVILSFTLMGAVSYYFVSMIVEKQIFYNSQESLKATEISIRSDLREAETALFHSGLLIERWMNQGLSIDHIKEHLNIIAGALSLDDAPVPGLMDVYGYILGDFISGIEWDPPGTYNPQHLEWYMAAMAAGGKIAFSFPYISNRSGKKVIAVTKSLNGNHGENYGAIALEIDFSHLSSYAEDLHDSEGSYGMLANEDFIFIIHPFSEYINKPMNMTHPAYGNVERQLQNDPDSIVSQKLLNRDGHYVILIFKQIFNGWKLGLAIPVSIYYRDVTQMAMALSVLGILFMVIFSFILIQLNLSKARSEKENLEKSSFLARMSHEIRTPMNSILGMAELIQRKAISSEIQEYIEIIQQSGNSLLAIINDILDFSKIESGRLQIQNQNYYLAYVINDMINMIRPRIAEKSLNFFVNVKSDIPAQLYGDDVRLRQILTNLLSNAVKYTRKGFISLDIDMEPLESGSLKLICSVKDSGIGIKPDDLKNLFNEFTRMDSKTNLGIEGTGLGLVITRALCRAMGGDVTVSSEYSKGTVFNAVIVQEYSDEKPVAMVVNPDDKKVLFYDWRPEYVESISETLKGLGISYHCPGVFHDFLNDLEHGRFDYAFISSNYAMDCIFTLGKRDTPLQLVIMVEPGEMSVYREITSISMPVYSITMANVLNNVTDNGMMQDNNLKVSFTAPSAKVLIVDDISTNLRVAKELMAPYEMTIHTCLSGSEAVNMVKNNFYDLVFMDHMMPGMDGIEAASFIRSINPGDGYYRNLPIVALTANALSGRREMFLENNINDFLAKPIKIQKLNEILERWLPAEKRIKTVQPFPAGGKPEKPGALSIGGVEVKLGLSNCGGDVAVYLSILSDFCKDAEARLVQITEAVTARDTKLYITLVHALKGAARSIGAIETGEKASWLEKAAASGDLAALKDKTTDLQENLRALINNIRATEEMYEAEDEREYTDISALKLDELKRALAEMDIEAVNRILLDYAGLSLDSTTKGLIAEVEQYILMFEYEKAVEKINELF